LVGETTPPPRRGPVGWIRFGGIASFTGPLLSSPGPFARPPPPGNAPRPVARPFGNKMLILGDPRPVCPPGRSSGPARPFPPQLPPRWPSPPLEPGWWLGAHCTKYRPLPGPPLKPGPFAPLGGPEEAALPRRLAPVLGLDPPRPEHDPWFFVFPPPPPAGLCSVRGPRRARGPARVFPPAAPSAPVARVGYLRLAPQARQATPPALRPPFFPPAAPRPRASSRGTSPLFGS